MKTNIIYALMSMFWIQTGVAATLSPEALYKMRIGLSKEVSIMSLVPMFKGGQNFRYHCVLDNDMYWSPDQISAELLVDFAPIAPSGVVSFYYDQGSGDDFDLSITKSLDEIPKALPAQEIETAGQASDTLSCVPGENYTCKSLKIDWERKYEEVQLGEKWDGPALWNRDWFAPGIDIEEGMEFFIFKRDKLYMTYKLNFSARQVGRFNQNAGTRSYSKNYVCELTPTDENVPRSGGSGTLSLPQPE